MKFITPIAMIVVMLIGTGCTEKNKMRFEKTITHANGLVVSVPKGFSITEANNGYVLTETANVRSPRQFHVHFEPQSATELDLKRNLDGSDKPVNYKIVELGGGSAGAEYEFIASKQVTGGYITVKAVEQSERGEPAFESAWVLIEVATVE